MKFLASDVTVRHAGEVEVYISGEFRLWRDGEEHVEIGYGRF